MAKAWPNFTLLNSPESPAWRRPQLGALGAIVAHWSAGRSAPALVSLPTGSGKTAVGLAARQIIRPTRTLVVVPSKDLREQLARSFSGSSILVELGALAKIESLTVEEVVGRVEDWEAFRDCDVVVALPNTISPSYYEDNPPPVDLFDLVIIDEAHHSPAPTWRSIIEHYSNAHVLLMTATPRRRDGQILPGEHIFHYPLRKALDEGIFQPVEPVLLDAPPVLDKLLSDEAICDAVMETLGDPVHARSTLMIRAGTKVRAETLAQMYRERGIGIEVLTSSTKAAPAKKIVADLRSGDLKAVAVVGKLIEGFDLPSLRVVAYHDKHRSLPVTAQLIGRLARVDPRFPQASVLVTVRDIDIYPELAGAVRELYQEDPDWARVLPGIIDDDIAADAADRDYAARFSAGPAELSVDALAPLLRVLVYEMDASGLPDADGLRVPDELAEGKTVRSQRVLYAGVSPTKSTLVLVTEAVVRPRWHTAPGLDMPEYALHVVSHLRAPRTDLPDLLLINSDDGGMVRYLLKVFDPDASRRPADPTRLQASFDSIERRSVSSVGMRNSYGGQPGMPTYKMYSGKGVDRGLRESDTAASALGHAMIQVEKAGSSFTAGVATEKAKYWETRYTALRGYDAFLAEFSARYWFPTGSISGQLLPQVGRGSRLSEWPDAFPVAVDQSGRLIGVDWRVGGSNSPLDMLDLVAGIPEAGPTGARERLPLVLVDPTNAETPLWSGYQDLLGEFHSTVDSVGSVSRGFSLQRPLEDLLTEFPPTIFFSNGATVIGTSIYESRQMNRGEPQVRFTDTNWVGVNINAETKKSAANKAAGISVHEELENHLKSRERRGRHRWVVHNDGGGEFADYVVIEVGPRGVFVDLWHAKGAGGEPSVRVTDFEVAVAQAIKSRRWITDPGFWAELGERLAGRRRPLATVIEGRQSLLEVLCGVSERRIAREFTRVRPVVTGSVAIVQPGLSLQKFRADIKVGPSVSAAQVRDLLAVFHDAVSPVADCGVWCHV